MKHQDFRRECKAGHSGAQSHARHINIYITCYTNISTTLHYLLLYSYIICIGFIFPLPAISTFHVNYFTFCITTTLYCIYIPITRSGLVWSSLVWSGLVWSGLVWSGLVWSGLVWCLQVLPSFAKVMPRSTPSHPQVVPR